MAAVSLAPDVAAAGGPSPLLGSAASTGWEASDAAWERLMVLLEASVLDIYSRFDALTINDFGLDDDRMRDEPQSIALAVAVLETESARADVQAIHVAGDGDLLIEVALNLVLDSLKCRAIPRFWASIPSASENADGELPRGWHAQLRSGVAALLQLHSAHISLLRCISVSSDSVDLYKASFRVAVHGSWPASFAAQLTRFFRRSWKLNAKQARCRAAEARERAAAGSLGEVDVEEWWWAAMPNQPAASGPANRVLLLLNPARRPAVLTGGDVAMAENGCGTASTPAWEAEADPWESDDAGDSNELSMDASCLDASDDEAASPSAAGASAALREVAEALQAMGLQDVWRDHVMGFIADEVASIVQDRCRSEYDAKGLLHQLTVWLYDPVLRWLRSAFGLSPVAARHLPLSRDAAGQDRHILEAEDAWWTSARRVVLQFFEIFVEVRILEAFDMVRDFPESIPALLDLRRCLARTGRTAPLVKALRQQLTRRLLIAGAHTRDVIKVYIKTIKAMRLVDPRGLLLEAVSAPIRAYLKRRKDTVRCIVTALTEDSELQMELHTGMEAVRQATAGAAAPAAARAATVTPSAGAAAGGRPATGANAQPAAPDAAPPANNAAAPPPNNAGAPAPPRPPPPPPPGPEHPGFSFGNVDHEASEEEEDPDTWVPDPIDADPWQPSRQRRAQDVISLLVGIYGSKEMFIKEYKEMLADRLLGTPSYGTERETQNLELLKTRFGEAALGHCEVMLQDIKDSKRINGNVQQNAKAKQAVATAPDENSAPDFRPPARSGLAIRPPAGTESSSRTFSAPFGLGGIFSAPFGMCLAPPASGGNAPAAAQGSIFAENPEQMLNAPGAAPPVESHDIRSLSLEQMQALVLSRHYWPSAFGKEDHPNFRLPAVLEDAIAEYSQAYTQIRAKRSLSWKRELGLVETTVQLADRSVKVVVTPVHLAVLACFQTDDDTEADGASGSTAPPAPSRRLSLQEVASRLELPDALIRKRIGFWVSKGVLREVSAGIFDVQEFLSTVEGVGTRGGSHLDDDMEHSPGTAAARAGGAGGGAACAAELEACEAFTQAMLTNYTSLPLGRIHNFLQMFMMDPPYTQTEAQLRTFLTRLCQEGKLEFNGSNYALVKKT